MSDTKQETKPEEFRMNKKQQEVKEVFDLMIHEGIDVPTAARYSVTAMPKPTKKFVEFLSDGALTYSKGKVVDKAAA